MGWIVKRLERRRLACSKISWANHSRIRSFLDVDSCVGWLPQLTADKEALVTTLPLAVSFAKQLSPLFLPPSPSSDPTPSEDASPAEADENIVPGAIKEKVKKLLGQYFEALSRKAVKDHLVRRSCSDSRRIRWLEG